jgi:probable rRNA maturation factor
MILNKQTKVRLATRPFEQFLHQTQRELQIAEAEITIAFVSDAEIVRWNEQYRRKKGPTDVLSFPTFAGAKEPGAARRNGALGSRSAHSYAPLATRDSPLFLGDIAIAPETAKRYARKNGRALGKELRVLILHGVLHLMGYDHECDDGQMDRIEQKLRRRLGIA